MTRGPDFIVIGAMKCASTTLHAQLGLQDGIYTCEPKEPGYFSHDEVYARGPDWYAQLFATAAPGALCGESSTHYTKLPTYPDCVARMRRDLAEVKLIYLMRDPIERVVSQYIHEWSQRTIVGSLEEALDRNETLTAYSCYAMQLEPYLVAFGRDAVLPVFLERMRSHPQGELERICRFIGYTATPCWHEQEERRNVSSDRLQDSAVRKLVMTAPVIRTLRRWMLPFSISDRVKQLWRMRERPVLAPERRRQLEAHFDTDLARLGAWLGAGLRCQDFAETVSRESLEWGPAAPDRT